MSLNLLTVFLFAIFSVLIVVFLLLFKRIQSKLSEQETQFMTNLKEQLTFSLQTQTEQLSHSREQILIQLGQNQQNMEKRLGEFGQGMEARHLNTLKVFQETLREGLKELTAGLDKLSKTTDERLKTISGEVEKRLNEGFEKTTATFTDIVKRLALIDDAQKKLNDLSSNVVSLQEILIDKRSRGAFGEIQLQSLVENIFPKEHVEFQSVLSNQTRVDCLLKLPEPTGAIPIDAKFPLENYQRYTDFKLPDSDRKKAQQAFKQDVKKHIQDIASKYIIRNETGAGAILFIPAEAIFAEIHHQFPELVSLAHQQNVWLASPTTMMAILTTASSVLKDQATKRHMHVIQDHLRILAEDFTRFQGRMTKLSKHIQQANDDVQLVNTSAQKISKRFEAIDKVEIAQVEAELIE